MANSGYAFEHETSTSLRAIPDTFVLKLVDTHLLQGFAYCANCESRITEDRKFRGNLILPRQPSDFLVVRAGKPFFIECKSSRNTVSYNIEYIAVHQLEYAFEVEKVGAMSWFVLTKRKPREMEAWALRPGELAEIIANMKTKAAVRWTTIAQVGRPLEHDTKDKMWQGWEALLH